METLKFKDKGNVKMIAHRGLSGLIAENTVPAFEAAGKASYYGIETDVHVTRDGKIIVVHDDDLRRVADLDLVVEENTFETLRAVRLKNLEGVIDENLYLPSLEEYIKICKKYDKQAILELKNEMSKEHVWAIADEVKELGWLERTTFISFSGVNLVNLRARYQTADAQYLTEESNQQEIAFMIENNLSADLSFECVTKEKVETLHQAGLKVNCWTVDALSDAEKMKACGVDMITTDILE